MICMQDIIVNIFTVVLRGSITLNTAEVTITLLGFRWLSAIPRARALNHVVWNEGRYFMNFDFKCCNKYMANVTEFSRRFLFID